MTTAKLVVFIDWDPDKTGVGAELSVGVNAIEIDIEVNEGDEPVKIEIGAHGITTSSKFEPRLIALERTVEEENP